MTLEYAPGIAIALPLGSLVVDFEQSVSHPEAEVRTLADIRGSLSSLDAQGPEDLYAIYMDVADEADRVSLIDGNLLFGVVRYAPGTVGDEPVRSQGHVHAVSASCGTSTPELYEFWEGEGAVFMQERVADQPGRCFAVHASPGDKVLVPPGWAHFTVNVGVTTPMTFGAWCVRDYGFDYRGIRERSGLAWYPKARGGDIVWEPNQNYETTEVIVKRPRKYIEFGITDDPIYSQWRSDHGRMGFVARPAEVDELWRQFVP